MLSHPKEPITQTQVEALLSTLHNKSSPAKLEFSVHKQPSSIANAGLGVFLKGQCKAGEIVCLYPGTVYLPFEPIFFVSIANRYILKCHDGVCIDGKQTGLSGSVYRSLYHRENWPGALQTSDLTWMSPVSKNPFAIGHYVNNSNHRFGANVRYQEVDLSPCFPTELRQYIPNTYWTSMDPMSTPFRIVTLVAERDLQEEELFSTYMDAHLM